MSIRSGIRGCLGFAFVVLVSMFASAALATGPVPVTALPGGGAVVDSDNGNGQAWGRVGGRTLIFNINDLSQFSALTWGVAYGTNPTLAFDGAVDASGETMTFASTSAGVATWIGTAVLPLTTGNVSVSTRFTLTVTDANNAPLPLTFESGGVSPGASVLATPQFKVHELFEMQWNGVWYPVLDKYDALNTIPGTAPSTNQGPVMTGLLTGFYYTGAGISLQDHDANMNAQLAAIKGDTAFIRTDATNRLQGLATQLGDVQNAVTNNVVLQGIASDVGNVKTAVNGNLAQGVSAVQQGVGQVQQSVGQLQQSVSQLLNSGGGNTATKSDVQGLQDTLLILWGLEPCPASAGPVCATAKFVQSLSTQASLDAVSGKLDGAIGGVAAVQTSVNALQGGISTLQSKVDALAGVVAGDVPLQLNVAQIAAPGNRMRWIVTMSRDGSLVPGTLQGIIAVLTTGSPATASDVLSRATVVQVAPGVLDVSLDVVKNVTDGSAYVFQARVADSTGTSAATALVVPK